MPVFGQVAAGIAAALHVVFFLFESVLFEQPEIRRRFRVEAAAAEAVRPWAFNQGFYNLFLALGCIVGLAAMRGGLGLDPTTARGFVILACACMVGAGVVLVSTDRRMLRPALMQSLPPLVALISLGT